jgi:hypothetical protein
VHLRTQVYSDFAGKAAKGSALASRLSESARYAGSASLTRLRSLIQFAVRGLTGLKLVTARINSKLPIVLRKLRLRHTFLCILDPREAPAKPPPWSLPGDDRSPFQLVHGCNVHSSHNVYYVK